MVTLLRAWSITIRPRDIAGLARHLGDARDDADRIAYASTRFVHRRRLHRLRGAGDSVFQGPATRLLFDRADHTTIFLVALFSIWANVFFRSCRYSSGSSCNSRHFAISNLVNTFISIGLTVWLVLFRRMGVLGVIVGQLAGRYVRVGIALYFDRRSLSIHLPSGETLEMLRFSLPLIPSSLGVFLTLYSRPDRHQGAVVPLRRGYLRDRLPASSPSWPADRQFPDRARASDLQQLPSSRSPGRDRADIPLLRCRRVDRADGRVPLCGRNSSFSLRLPSYYGAASVVALLASATLLSEMYMFAQDWPSRTKRGGSA